MAGSLLHAIGMPELVADSKEGYEALALKLANDRPLREALRTKLAANQGTHATMALSTNRKTMDGDKEFVHLREKLLGTI